MIGWLPAGRTALITGASDGIGRATALALAEHQLHLLLIGRDSRRYAPLISEIEDRGGSAEILETELADLRSVAMTGLHLATMASTPSLLIYNAGITGRGATDDGFDLAFGVNHLAHFLITRLVLDRLLSTPPVRIVTVASNAHYGLKEFSWEEASRPVSNSTGFRKYKMSKAANIAFTQELARRWGSPGLTAVALHPGVVATGLWDRIPRPFRKWFTARMLSPEEGARVTLRCSIEDDLKSGGYYTPSGPRSPAPYAMEPSRTESLWKLSERLTAPWI